MGRKPSLTYFKVWGCLAKVLVPEYKWQNLRPKTINVIFLGYMEHFYAFRFLVIKSENTSIHVNTIVEFRDATLFEVVFSIKPGVPQKFQIKIKTPH